MSPHNSDQSATDFYPTSPWTDAYQANPMHSTGEYSLSNYSNLHEDETVAPTWEALSNIYDTSVRE